ncbi:adenosine receptor A3 isoform X2 [Exaiptasia diaphana]|uniref:G-protein coupled receptors family 1 profile domain-containing protein n=1 Tax=Exaiptasia diaphana TaxID=2652724 RepID=A0A913XU71_EXADI|nr:adenosine receptor A3 isoform X2 [Exaiptasia diaphana]
MSSTVNVMNNLSMTTATPQPVQESPVWYWVVSLLISIVTSIGNGIVMYLIISRPSLHLTNNYFILSLAVADIMTGVFVIPSTYIFEVLKIYDLRFDVVLVFINTFFFASVFNVCALTLDRYISIVIPLKYFLYMNNKRVISIIALAWIIPFIIAGIYLILKYYAPEANRVYEPLQIFICVIVPIILMLIIYVRIYIIARRLSKQTSQTTNQLRFNDANANGTTEDTVIMKKERRERRNREGSVAVLGAVIILFALCWLVPVYNTICQIFQVCPFSFISIKVANILLHLNSSINPIVYAVLKKDIRRELLKIFCGRQRQSVGGSFGTNSTYSFAANTSTKIEMR